MPNTFVIDDTGSPGNPLESVILKSDRKTYVAVFIHSDIEKILVNELKALLTKYSTPEETLDEFHFTDIVNRRKQFSTYDQNGILTIFEDIANVLNKFTLPYFNQTITPRTLEENGLKNNLNKSLDEIALDFLFLRIKNFIVQHNIPEQLCFIIDEGVKKKGQEIQIEILKSVTTNNILKFQESNKNILLQVADLFAFALNRHQMMIVKETMTEFDIKLHHLLSSILYSNNVSGSGSMFIKDEEFNKETYDKVQIDYMKKMGIYEFWKKRNK